MFEDDELVELQIKRVIGPTSKGAAVFLEAEDKTFTINIGIYEGTAIARELSGEVPARPLTHELLASILDGFHLEVARIVINEFSDGTFKAKIYLEQKSVSEDGEWNGRRQMAVIDARPSDCMVIALKQKCKIFGTRHMLEQVSDIKDDLDFFAVLGGDGVKSGPGQNNTNLKELDITGLQDLPGLFDKKAQKPESDQD